MIYYDRLGGFITSLLKNVYVTEIWRRILEKDNIKNHYECSIEHFIQDEYSICREERQYAVFLYNILRKYRNKDKRIDKEVVSIFDACNIPRGAEIQNVFYEATFMRISLKRNRRLALSKIQRIYC